MTSRLKITKNKNRRLTVILATATFLTLWPLIAIPFTHKLNRTASELLVMGAMLFGIGLTCEVVMREVKSNEWRIFIFVAILVILFIAFPNLM